MIVRLMFTKFQDVSYQIHYINSNLLQVFDFYITVFDQSKFFSRKFPKPQLQTKNWGSDWTFVNWYNTTRTLLKNTRFTFSSSWNTFSTTFREVSHLRLSSVKFIRYRPITYFRAGRLPSKRPAFSARTGHKWWRRPGLRHLDASASWFFHGGAKREAIG